MTSKSSSGAPNNEAPTVSTDAVLKPSAPVDEGVQEVQGIEFNDYQNRDITVSELVDGMTNMGFQASAVAEAVRIINSMVSLYTLPFYTSIPS